MHKRSGNGSAYDFQLSPPELPTMQVPRPAPRAADVSEPANRRPKSTIQRELNLSNALRLVILCAMLLLWHRLSAVHTSTGSSAMQAEPLAELSTAPPSEPEDTAEAKASQEADPPPDPPPLDLEEVGTPPPPPVPLQREEREESFRVAGRAVSPGDRLGTASGNALEPFILRKDVLRISLSACTSSDRMFSWHSTAKKAKRSKGGAGEKMVAEEEEEDDEADEGLDGMDGGEVAPIVSGAGCPLDGRLLQPVMKQLRSRRDGVEPRGIVVGWQRIRESPSDLPVYALLAPPEPVPSCDPACLSHGGLTGVLAGGAPPPSGRHLSSRTRLERRGVWPKKCRLSSCPEREAHASNLLALPGGHLLCAWFSGHEGSGDVSIALSRLPAGATQWEPGVRISGEAGRSAQNPVLFQDTSPTGNGTGRVHLLHTSQLAGKGQGTSEIWHLHSDDDGATWSPAVILTTEGFQRKGVFLRNQLLKQHFVKGRSEEEWLLPMYYTPGGLQTHHSALQWSTDRGYTWHTSPMSLPGQGLVQPTIVASAPGELTAFFRQRFEPNLFVSTSKDGGRSWTPGARTKFPSNNSGIQALRLASGAIVLVFNNIRTKIRRDPLSVALSTDGGKSWPYVRDIEVGGAADPASGKVRMLGYSYPSVVQTEDGAIHVSYTFNREAIKYVRITEEWIKTIEGSSGVFQGGWI
ncbi:hypothetical protein CYMTET_17742 [Cymbomonas tetramitiformis]|uniref:Sialidase domain-containing protein n=1 Tax=Cymbomonas tetramitiformis TaxID=36881 RepID=A0AAE0GAV4_9CHLO|nr:hypothetical protein CYMTET_17742 [Cymbomonas tetramitiformis]